VANLILSPFALIHPLKSPLTTINLSLKKTSSNHRHTSIMFSKAQYNVPPRSARNDNTRPLGSSSCAVFLTLQDLYQTITARNWQPRTIILVNPSQPPTQNCKHTTGGRDTPINSSWTWAGTSTSRWRTKSGFAPWGAFSSPLVSDTAFNK